MPPQAKTKPSKKSTVEFVADLMKQNKLLLEEVNKIRMPHQMTPKEFNWCVQHLNKVKVLFETSEKIPQPVDEEKA